MEIFGLDLGFIPTTKLVTCLAILMVASALASLTLFSSNPTVKFIKRALLLFSLLGIIYLNIHSYSSSPYIFLAAEIAVLAMCYKLYLGVLKKLINTKDDVDVASSYLEEIKRRRELR
jgi:hypothetical protein